MSEVIDAQFTDAERDKLLTEVRSTLPAFLLASATEQHDPVGDVKELLDLDEADLARVISVHLCLDPRTMRFGDALREGLRNPVTSSIRPPEVSQTVRGPVDWGATTRRRSLEAGNPTLFVVRYAHRIFDTPENRALVWLIAQLRTVARRAYPSAEEVEDDVEVAGWVGRIERLLSQFQQARRVHWLRGVKPMAPSPATIKRLRAARSAFYAQIIPAALEALLRARQPNEEELAEVLCQRYFRPRETWRLFEVAVALRLARRFSEASPLPRRTRLLIGSARTGYARYTLDDGDDIVLIYQAWAAKPGASIRWDTAKRHGFKPGSSRPDLFIVRRGKEPDCAILELKATYSAGYLGSGLSQLLGYIAERPSLWQRNPAGWLVAPASQTFTDAPAQDDEPLWVVSAEQVAQAAIDRFTA